MTLASNAKPEVRLGGPSADHAILDRAAAELSNPEPANDNIHSKTNFDHGGSPYGAAAPNMWWVP